MSVTPAVQPRAEDKHPVSSMSARDIVLEAFAGMFARPGRMLLTVLGTTIGLAALVATLGLSRTAGQQIIGRFDELAATEITVTSLPVEEGRPSNDLPWDAPRRLERLNGVVAAGTLTAVDVGGVLVSGSAVQDPLNRSAFKLPVEAASPGLFETVRARMGAGRLIDAGHSRRADHVAVLGPNAAEQLGVTRIDGLRSISIGDEVFLVIGMLDSVQRKHDLLSSVIIPEGTARRLYHVSAPESVVAETEVGAASMLSRQVPLALRPDAPNGLKVASPEQPQRIRAGIEADLNLLFLMLGGVSLLVGAIGIANVTLVSVMERIGEIGLRRALGATRRHIATQFLLESATMGAVGGVLGASAGMLVVTVVAAYQTWTPVIDPLIPLLAPVVGGATGLLAGLYPAVRAAGLEPVEALRAGT
ncbi:MAG TPA: ABC transporter permease [Nocardioidaceae bacterium]|nr:ABC transporter permease [Nocardioidaceae bacterium]